MLNLTCMNSQPILNRTWNYLSISGCHRWTSPQGLTDDLVSPLWETAPYWWRTALPSHRRVAEACGRATTSWRSTASRWRTTRRPRRWSRRHRAARCGWGCCAWAAGRSAAAAASRTRSRAVMASGWTANTRPWSSTRRSGPRVTERDRKRVREKGRGGVERKVEGEREYKVSVAKDFTG